MELVEHRVRTADNGRVRVEGEILYANGVRETVWIEVAEQWEPAINRSGDPWIVSLAPLAVTLGEPLRVPLAADAKLAEGVRKAAGVWRFWDSTLPALELEVPTEERAPAPTASRVGSLFSGGVDSWYTVLRNQDESEGREGAEP